jgi:hypothetical protein
MRMKFASTWRDRKLFRSGDRQFFATNFALARSPSADGYGTMQIP